MSIEQSETNGIYYVSGLSSPKWFFAFEEERLEIAYKLAEALRKKHKAQVTMILPGSPGSFQEEMDRKFPVVEFHCVTRNR